MSSTDDIKALESTKWRTALSGRIEAFSSLIEDQTVFDKYFGEKYVEKLTEKIRHLNRLTLLLGIAYAILMISLFASQDPGKSEFEVFGYGFKNISHYKEFLLLFAAGITPISTGISAYQKYLVAIRSECLKKLIPDANTRDFYSQIYLDNYLDPLIKSSTSAESRVHGLTKILAAIAGLVIIFLAITLLAGSFLIQASVVHDVATNPALPKHVNTFVITFALTAIGLSWLIGMLQLPLPEIDLSNYKRLSLLKQSDPSKYDETMRRIARESRKRETYSSLLLSLILFVVSYITVSVVWNPSSLNDVTSFVTKALPGAFITLFLSQALTTWVRKRLFGWFFKKYPDESDHRMQVFDKVRRIHTLARLLIPLAISVTYAIYRLQTP